MTDLYPPAEPLTPEEVDAIAARMDIWSAYGPDPSDTIERLIATIHVRVPEVERLAEAVFRVGTGYRERWTAGIAGRIANSQDGAKASLEFAEHVAAEYARMVRR